MEDQFSLLKCPFSFNIEAASSSLQLELIDLQVDRTQNVKLTEFYASLNADNFGNLNTFAKKCIWSLLQCMFVNRLSRVCTLINQRKQVSLTDLNLCSVCV